MRVRVVIPDAVFHSAEGGQRNAALYAALRRGGIDPTQPVLCRRDEAGKQTVAFGDALPCLEPGDDA